MKTIIEPTDIDKTSISRLVVLIHGYRANADSWPKEMAQKLAKLSNDLHVLSVDWREGAALSIPFYTPAAANTRYVGVATERVVRQQTQDTFIALVTALELILVASLGMP